MRNKCACCLLRQCRRAGAFNTRRAGRIVMHQVCFDELATGDPRLTMTTTTRTTAATEREPLLCPPPFLVCVVICSSRTHANNTRRRRRRGVNCGADTSALYAFGRAMHAMCSNTPFTRGKMLSCWLSPVWVSARSRLSLLRVIGQRTTSCVVIIVQL